MHVRSSVTAARPSRTAFLTRNLLEKGHTVIHKNFHELDICANSFCDLCKYLRREICYFTADDNVYGFRSRDLEDHHNNIRIEIYLAKSEVSGDGTDIRDRLWQIFLGGTKGPLGLRCHNQRKQRQLVNRQARPLQELLQ